MPNLGGWEWVIIAVVALVLFGGAKLANFGKNAGKAIREFKEETKTPGEVEAPPAAPPAAAPPVAPEVSAPQPAPQTREEGPRS